MTCYKFHQEMHKSKACRRIKYKIHTEHRMEENKTHERAGIHEPPHVLACKISVTSDCLEARGTGGAREFDAASFTRP